MVRAQTKEVREGRGKLRVQAEYEAFVSTWCVLRQRKSGLTILQRG